MRNAFAEEITKIGAADDRVVLLSGDIGNRLFDDFKDRAPDRFFNCGVAEANMMSVAAGMALSGLRPVVYTITPFVTTRCLEQIRDDVCYHKAPVTIVGVGSGLGYASLGATHQSLEDIAFLRLFPEMVVLCPADPAEARAALNAALAQQQPAYIRLGKKGEPAIRAGETPFRLGRADWLRDGPDVCLIGTGAGVKCALDAADMLQKRGFGAAVVAMPTLKPIDQAALTKIAAEFSAIATVEEHNRSGGLGGLVAEWLCDEHLDRPPRLFRLGTRDMFLHEATSRSHAQRRHGMAPDQIAETLAAALPQRKP
jgi:transketolase